MRVDQFSEYIGSLKDNITVASMPHAQELVTYCANLFKDVEKVTNEQMDWIDLKYFESLVDKINKANEFVDEFEY